MRKSKREIREPRETENNYKFNWSFSGEKWWTTIPARNMIEAENEFKDAYGVTQYEVKCLDK
jgi:hypothetical protein